MFNRQIPWRLHRHSFTITTTSSFLPSVVDPSWAAHSVQSADSLASSSSLLSSTTSASGNFLEVAGTYYGQELRNDPLKTKVLTGIVLAIVGDALAQIRVVDEPYNVKRAVSFALFDGCYRAVQQATYPPMMKLCAGKFLTSLFVAATATTAISQETTKLFASMEQTLVSQLVIIPTLYYPVFYAVTGAVQGLTLEETVQRAKETFIPLMKRNLLFWIPVQFITFEFIEENLQIPILIVCGLVWTIILSVSAGAAKATAGIYGTPRMYINGQPHQTINSVTGFWSGTNGAGLGGENGGASGGFSSGNQAINLVECLGKCEVRIRDSPDR